MIAGAAYLFYAAGAVVLLAALAGALIPPRDCCLFRGGLVLAGVLALLWGGTLVMRPFNLAWRNLPGGLLAGAALLCAVVLLLRTAVWTLVRPMGRLPAAVRVTVRAAVLAGAGVLLYYGLMFGPLMVVMAYAGGERVVTYEGRVLLEVDNSFVDQIYNYYEYRGPILRGAEPVCGSQYEPLVPTE